MKTAALGKSGIEAPAVISGCMRMNRLDKKQAAAYIEACIEYGINYFDHADIYGKGSCEELFGEALAMTAVKREQIILQSKCGICPGKMYDFSEEYIVKSVEGILKRLRTDYLDVLVLHRPDALMEPEEVAAAFDKLEAEGKVRYFGVSNHRATQIELLKKCVKQEIQVNQLQFGVSFSNMIASGMEVNMTTAGAADRDGGILEYCHLKDITVQAWSPFQAGDQSGIIIGNPNYPELNLALEEIGQRYGISATASAAAWVLRHPASIQLVSGTMNLKRLEEIARAADIRLTREEWYRIYLAGGHILP